MRTKHQNQFSALYIFFSFLILTFIFSCKTKDTPTPTEENGTLAFHIHTMADTSEVESYGDTLILTGGRRITVDMAQLYISHIELVKSDGSTVSAPNTILLVKQGVEDYEIGSVPAGNYKSVKFYIGLDAATNSSTPLSSDNTLYQSSMWFGAAAQPEGFIYVNFQGTIDTATAPSDANALIPFSYKLGTADSYKQVAMSPQNFTVTPSQTQFVHLEVDYNLLLNGIKLNESGNLSATQAIQDNISMTFKYE